MPAEAWIALGFGLTTILGTILGVSWRVSTQLATTVTKFELIGTQQAVEITEIKNSVSKTDTAIEKIGVTLHEMALDRENSRGNQQRNDDRFRALDLAIAEIRQDIKDMRRGEGFHFPIAGKPKPA